MCRATSRFIIPSSRFWKEGTAEKERVVQAYKDSMARVPCRSVLSFISNLLSFTPIHSYFQKSIQKNKNKPLCPYGKDCFYQHLNDDGTPYIFKEGVDASMRVSSSAALSPLTHPALFRNTVSLSPFAVAFLSPLIPTTSTSCPSPPPSTP